MTGTTRRNESVRCGNGAREDGLGAALLTELRHASYRIATRAAPGATVLPRDRAFTPGAPVPFEHVWAPLLVVARRRVRRASGRRAYACFTGAAHAGVERVLLARVSELSTRALYRVYNSGYPDRPPGAYAAFVRAQLAGGLGDLFAAHPVLARLVATLVADWVDATAELLVRFAADACAVAAALGRGKVGRILRVEAGLSDPHAHARQVAILHPPHGGPVVYKPRSLVFDVAYAELVAWLDKALPPGTPRPRALRVLDRGTHGWAEHAAASPCADEAASARYFERMGAVLCLAHVLRGSDLHSENVVAAGEHPVMIDLEVLCRPVPSEGAHAHDGLEPSVLDTGLLPEARVAGNGVGYLEGGILLPNFDTSARAAAPGQDGPWWTQVNTDAMHWGSRTRLPTDPQSEAQAREPRTAVRGYDATAAAAAVQRGFRRTYQVLGARRAELLSGTGPLAAFAGGASRVLLRATSVYLVLLRRTTHPDFLGGEAKRLAELDVLRGPYLRAAERPGLWPTLDAERDAMQRSDVPIFTVPADGTDLCGPGGEVLVAGYASMSGYASVRRGVAQMSDARLRRQLHHIKIALAADRHRRRRDSDHDAAAPVDGAPLTPDQALAEAGQLAALLRSVAATSPGGGARWYAQDVGGGQRWIAAAGDGLEAGRAGIGLFFAAHAYVLRGHGIDADEATEWAYRALRPVCDSARQPARRTVSSGPGLAVGWGGIAYALSSAAAFLGDAGLLEAARAALVRMGPPRPRVLADVFAGAAGGVLGALAVHGVTGDADALDLALAWGEWLLVRCEWRVGEPGFGHGPPGVVAALLRLGTRAGDERFASPEVRAALTAAADGRECGRGPSTIRGWCRGTPGLGLACAAALAAEAGTGDEQALWRSALAGAASDAAMDGRAPWTLCCGAFARVEVNLAAAAALGRPEFVHNARVLAGRVVAGARRRRSYAYPALAESLSPGLLRGVAGVAYTLLRVSDPSAVPSPLQADLPARACCS